MLVKGDKIQLVKEMGMFKNVGEICDVIDVNEQGVITFKFGGGMHMGCMSTDEFEKYFVKYEEPKKACSVTEEIVEEIMNHTKVNVHTVFGKCTIVACQLPNGFVIVESSACVDPANYDEDMGVEICMNRIIDKVWELEGYRLQEALYVKSKCDTVHCDMDCNNCCCDEDCDECPYDDEWNWDEDDCTTNDLDCDDCEEREDCPFYMG